MTPFPYAGILLNIEFTPYLWEDNTDEYIRTIEGCRVYVKISGGVISVTKDSTNERLLTTYFSNLEGFVMELGRAMSTAYGER